MQSTLHFPMASRSDCINDFIVKKFIEHCGCLPSGLPVQLKHFDNHTYCFNLTHSQQLLAIESCYQAQVASMPQYETEAHRSCLPQCETQRYSIRQSSHPWPNLRRETAVKFLKVLAELHGYPDEMRSTWGESALYFMYERAAQLVDQKSSEKSAEDWINFSRQLEALQDQLAMVSVQGRQPFGEETFEEEAYPTKNLLADVGGALGLWSGVSVLTVCELVELCIYMVAAVRYRIAHPQTSTTADPYNEVDSPLRSSGHAADKEAVKMFAAEGGILNADTDV
ncbi:hypothetical protein BOX15_Mlig024348g1 [Macrostomum lignano]|uniref:Uncharacterized protein n=1 Tax=Macrostomum lignano TaxID=282301 RepID=A0A267H346_9PLAT|nr:hypothetical protein BOX15_Mlig024348g1 [Macrostomum lignano]